jgi:hypothetical protein
MKFKISIFVLLVSFAAGTAARAQRPLKIITYDSLAADSLNVNIDIDQAQGNVIGYSNNSNVTLKTPGDWVFAKFFHGATQSVTFEPGSTIEFYWQRSNNDVGKAWFILRYFRDADWFSPDGPGDTVFVTQTGTAPQKYVMTVTGSSYNTVEVHMDTSVGAKPVFIDAIVLHQHGTLDSVGNTASVDAPLAQAAGFSCYPNPFLASEGATLHPVGDGRGSYVVMDLLGREVMNVEATTTAHISVPTGGTYFVRRRIGDSWAGAPLRVSAE